MSGFTARPRKFISSASNDLYRTWLDCLTGKGIRKHGMFIMGGERAVAETTQRFPELVVNVLWREGADVASAQPTRGAAGEHAAVTAKRTSVMTADSHSNIGEMLSQSAAAPIDLAGALFDELNTAGAPGPLLVLKTPAIAEIDLTQPPQGLEVLCALGDPSNVGALMRSCAAFGASKVVLLKESATPFHPKAVRAASATTLLTPLAQGPSIHDLPAIAEKSSGAPDWIALDMHGTSIFEFKWPKNARIVIGEEGPGVPSPDSFTRVSIPMQNGVESLNATVAASLAIFSYRQAHLGR